MTALEEVNDATQTSGHSVMKLRQIYCNPASHCNELRKYAKKHCVEVLLLFDTHTLASNGNLAQKCTTSDVLYLAYNWNHQPSYKDMKQ